MVALQVQGFCWIFAIFLAPIIPRIGFYGLKYKAFSIIQCTLNNSPQIICGEFLQQQQPQPYSFPYQPPAEGRAVG